MKDIKPYGRPKYVPGKRQKDGINTAVNVCNRPGLGASKNDLSELHDEKMRNKRLRYHAKDKRGHPTYQTHQHYPTSGNEGYHQIWPDNKFAGRHNDCATSVQYHKAA